MRSRSTLFRVLGALFALALVASACSSDDDTDTSAGDTASSVPDDADDSADDADDGADDDADGTADIDPANAEVCALAAEMNEQDDLPSAEQLSKYQDLAPDEIAEDVDVAASQLIEAEGFVDFLAIFAKDDVEEAVENIEEWEAENCGIESDGPGGELPPGATEEIEPDAARVDVVAVDYDFEVDGEIAAGRTSFVLTNDGDEAHFLGIIKLAEGVALEDAIQSEDESVAEGFWESGTAAPGGEDEEVITFDLEPGSYGMVCFIPDASFTPHAFLGMAVPFEVA